MEVLGRIRADRAFIGANGIEAAAGVTNANFPEAEIKRVMMGMAREKIVVADQSKVGHVATALIAPISDVDLLITTLGAAEGEIENLKAKGLAIKVV